MRCGDGKREDRRGLSGGSREREGGKGRKGGKEGKVNGIDIWGCWVRVGEHWSWSGFGLRGFFLRGWYQSGY